ncbi:endoplasmic reticulum vesicle transporter-domain-containing protein [Entophlyctis helioformis]|nr:endoplasmic reticulum vesicle transporter-domain-containing protein [Entophlyctis helioformis]
MVDKGAVERRMSKRFTAFDAFPKIESQLQHTTQSGGLVSVVMLALLAYLAGSEIWRWRTIHQKYEFLVDQTRSHEHELQVNVDLTIAMDCKYLRADVLDVAHTSLPVKDLLHASPASELTVDPCSHMDKHLGDTLNVHALLRDKARQRTKLAEVAGNPNAFEGMLHFTAVGHGYFGSHTPHDAINFTHRIDELSFGKRYPGLWNPLDHTLEVGKTNFDNFLYYLGVVPTIYVDSARTIFQDVVLTNQYAVTEFSHAIDPETPDTLPGIFVKYNIEPVLVRVTEYRQPLIPFITRMCGIVGGAFVTIGAILNAVHTIGDWMRR